MSDISALMSRNTNFKIRWVRRSANKVADLVAKTALKEALPGYWTWLTPVKIRTAILEDNLVRSSSFPP